MRGNDSSGWTGDTSVTGAFSAERWLALLPDCVENLRAGRAYHGLLNYFEIAQSAYIYRCTHSYRNCLSQASGRTSLILAMRHPDLCGPLYHSFLCNARIEDSMRIVSDACLVTFILLGLG
jgi:hypothetical protein